MGGELSLITQLIVLQISTIGMIGCLIVVAFGLEKWTKKLKELTKKIDKMDEAIKEIG